MCLSLLLVSQVHPQRSGERWESLTFNTWGICAIINIETNGGFAKLASKEGNACNAEKGSLPGKYVGFQIRRQLEVMAILLA